MKCASCNQSYNTRRHTHCPACGQRAPNTFLMPAKSLPFFAVPEMRYQNAYVWLVLVSALDVILTMLVLTVWGGSEVNPVVASIIHEIGFFWAIVFKFAVVLGVIIICEVVGRISDSKGRRLARFAVALSALPVVYTFSLLMRAGPPPTPPAI